MVVKASILALLSGAFGSLVTLMYTNVFASKLWDFGTYSPSTMYNLAYNFFVTIGASALFVVLYKATKRVQLSEFIVGFSLASLSIGLTLVTILQDFPTFKANSDNEMMGFTYYGLVISLISFPVLSWLVFKSLFIKKD